MKSLCSFGVISSTLMFWQMGSIVAICLYFSNPSTGRCKMGTIGTPHTANSILSPKCLLFICPDPRGEKGWHRSLADVYLPFSSLEKEDQGQAGGTSACAASAENMQFQGFGALELNVFLQVFFWLSITSLFSVPSRGIGSRDWRGTGWSDHRFCSLMGLGADAHCFTFISSLRSGMVASLPLYPRARHRAWHIVSGQYILLKACA